MNAGKYIDPIGKTPRTAEEVRHEATGILQFLSGPDVRERDLYEKGVFPIDLDEGSAFHRMRLDTTLRLLTQVVEGGLCARTLLDIGCGLGQTLEAVEKAFREIELTGLDLSWTALERAARRLPQVELVLGDCGSLPFSDGYFDVVILNNLIEHVWDPLPLLHRVNRILAPGGAVIVSTPSRYRFDNLFRAVLGRPMDRMSADHIVEFSVGQVSEMLAHAGFEITKIEGPRRSLARRTVRNTLSGALLKPLLRAWTTSVQSTHVLETTSFFLARRVDSREADPGGVPSPR